MEERTLCSICNENVREEEKKEKRRKKQKDSQSNAQESPFFPITLEKWKQIASIKQGDGTRERERERENVKGGKKSAARHSLGFCDLFHLTYSINHGHEHRRAGKYACAIKHNERAGDRHGKDREREISFSSFRA